MLLSQQIFSSVNAGRGCRKGPDWWLGSGPPVRFSGAVDFYLFLFECNALTLTQAAYTLANIQAALSRKLINVSAIDTAVSHVLTMKFASGLFERPYEVEAPKDTQRFTALYGAQDSLVLAINKDTLPVKSSSSFAIVGELGGTDATATNAMTGPYTQGGADVPGVIDAFTNLVSKASYSSGASPDKAADQTEIQAAVHISSESDVTVAVLGDSDSTCGEWHDRSDLDLPGGQVMI